MLRDIVMAFCFGSAPEVAAFMVAYRLANLFRRLFGEGNLQGGFVPHFERLRLESDAPAARFYRDLFFSIIIALMILTGISSAVCWTLGYWIDSDIPFMMMAMMPGVIFLCLYALNSSVLQCQRRYFLPALAPVAFNAVWIIAALFLSGKGLKDAMFGLSIGVLAAFGLQWWMTSPPVTKWAHGAIGWREWLRPHPFSSEVRVLLKPLTFGIVGIGAAQINSAVDAIFARLADPSGPAYLWYAIRIQQLPLALFGIALAGALLPPLSRAMQSNQLDKYRELLQGGLRQSAALMIPCAVGMVVLAVPGLDLLYGHGGFQGGDVAQTGVCLQAYALGLVPMVFVLMLANGFYAQKSYRWPMHCSLVSVACNALLNIIFVFVLHWGAASIALATAVSAFLNCAMLAHGLQAHIGSFSLWRGNGRISLCSLLAAAAALLADSLVPHQRDFASQASRFLVTASAFGITGLAMAYWLDVKEIIKLMNWKKSPTEESGA